MSEVTCVVGPRVLEGERCELSGETFHHLFRVRRLEVGVRLRLVDGAGTARLGVVEAVGRNASTVRLRGPLPSNEAATALELWVPALRPQRMSWLVEKATEVGVDAIHWIPAQRTARRATGARCDRLRRVAVAAVEQCGRAMVPRIESHPDWGEAVGVPERVTDAWYLDATGDPLPVAPPGATAALFVGPEGGWTDAERSRLAAAGARPLALGDRILRVETAAIVASGLLLCRPGVAVEL